MSAERVVQAALYAALTGDTPYMALVSGVYDEEAPQGTDYPYTVLGSMTEVPAHVMEADGWEHTITIHDFTDAKGRKVLQQIREAREVVVHKQILSVSGFGLTSMLCEFADVLVESDENGKTIRHQVTRYRVQSLATA
jgi:hypothetical protein